jgi:transposase
LPKITSPTTFLRYFDSFLIEKPPTHSHFQVRFSDEKRFLIYNDGPLGVWRKDDDRFKQKFVRGTVKNRMGVMAWLCISADGQSRLVRCPERVDSESYQRDILAPNMRFIKHRHIVFMQDGASCHTSRSTMAYLQSHSVTVLTPWPAMSPDLNPVEHCWAWLAKQMIGQHFTSADALWAGLQATWATVPPTLIPALYGSMVRRLTAVQVARGGHTRY